LFPHYLSGYGWRDRVVATSDEITALSAR